MWRMYRKRKLGKYCIKNGPFNVLDDYEEFCDIMPRTLKYWPTYYTLDEVKSFFRPPMLYDAENIEMRKETDPLQIEGNLYLGKNTQEISIPLNILKETCFCMWCARCRKNKYNVTYML